MQEQEQWRPLQFQLEQQQQEEDDDELTEIIEAQKRKFKDLYRKEEKDQATESDETKERPAEESNR